MFHPRIIESYSTPSKRKAKRPGLIAAIACWLAVCLVIARGASAQITPGTITADPQPIASGLGAPLSLVEPNDGSNRLFVPDQTGKIRIIQGGSLLPTPFLDLTSTIPVLNANFDERGVLGMAFHPNYAQNGRFFVRYSVSRPGIAGEPCFGTSRGCHREVLSEFTVSGDPNVANPTPTELLSVDKPQFNHNGGGVAFGPDGYLYMSLGDGGGANDGLADSPPSHGPGGNGQNTQVLLGKVHRLDLSTPGTYSIPPTNPFANGVNGRPEIYAYGLRNPYAFSFDDRPGGTNRLYLGDVGQLLVEELDIIENGKNYGWVKKEGTLCFDPFNPTVPPPPATCANATGPFGEPLIDPIAQYLHPQGVSIIGGFVYRGSQFPELYGKYLFGDFSQNGINPLGRLLYMDVDAGSTQIQEFILNVPFGRFLRGIGQDADGEIYLLTTTVRGTSGTTGEVLHLTPEPSSLCLIAVAVVLARARRRRS
jgi:glucose/arabinose dehydrogenase